MPEEKFISLINLSELSKPASILIEKVASAVGGLLKPWQIKRTAKAESVAALIQAKTEIKITELHNRAMCRLVEEEAIRQKNMENITIKALPQIQENSDPSKMEDDWVTNFFDKARIVSDAEMQEIWAKILAGEANKPRTYSKRTINLLSDMDTRDAKLFQSLCNFVWLADKPLPLVFDFQDDIYENEGIDFTTLTHLDSIGLIKFDNLAGFMIKYKNLPIQINIKYCKYNFSLDINDTGFEIGNVLFTAVGNELFNICTIQEIQGFYDYVKDKFKKYIPK